jgi:6,7-dimethyl-8-ribityllumazine synthase
VINEPLNILIVEARAYAAPADALLAGAKAALTAAKAEFAVVSVPGVLELAPVVAMAEEGGHRPAGVRYDGYVALGCVMRDETYHYEVAARESARGLMDLAIGRRLAIGSGILTVEDEAQALRHADPAANDKGGLAARACLAVIAVKRGLLGQVR